MVRRHVPNSKCGVWLTAYILPISFLDVFNVYLCVCAYVSTFVYIHVGRGRPEEGAMCPGKGVVSDCKLPDVGTGN